MKQFKSIQDLSQLSPANPAHNIIKSLIDLTITPYDTPERAPMTPTRKASSC